MKHIRPFNEIIGWNTVKEFIDWKRVNFIIDKLTKFEDDGYSVHISISYFDKDKEIKGNILTLAYVYHTREGSKKPSYFGEIKNMDELDSIFNENRVLYCITLFQQNSNLQPIGEFLNEISSLLSSKLELKYNDSLDAYYQWV